MTTRTMAILACTVGLALPAEGMASKKSGPVTLFQDALAGADENVESSGTFDEQTRSAMQSVQERSGLETTDYPDAGVLSALAIPPSAWAGIVKASGAPETEIQNAVDAANSAIADYLAGDMRDVFTPADAE